MPTATTLPPHTIRKSRRARKIGLLVHPKKGVELVLPYGVSEKEGLAFLRREQAWVEKQLAKMVPEPEVDLEQFPETICLPCIDKTWQLEYVFSLYQRPVLRELEDQILLIGKEESFAYFQQRLLMWVRHQAHQILTPWLQQLSEETGLVFSKVSYRGQSTRWGSCSEEGNISLNYKLLFLSPELVRYVLIHELCHTVHMNHGKRFWVLVKKHVPDYQRLIKHLDRKAKLIPNWLE